MGFVQNNEQAMMSFSIDYISCTENVQGGIAKSTGIKNNTIQLLKVIIKS